MLERLLFVLTHVASQLSYRWYPPPVSPPLDDVFARGASAPARSLAALALDDWRDLIRFEAQSGGLPWLAAHLARDQGGALLAAAAHRHVQAVESAGARLVTLVDEEYPLLLERIPDPPLALTVLGPVERLSTACISIVGSRKASAHALRESFHLGRRLSARGNVIVSGGALGCDVAAHRGVLASESAKARAVIVFAGGLSSLYPRANARWFAELRARRAALVSERLWDAPCRPVDFPARNRIVAGLSRTTLVMQAARSSGALITARFALDQGREVGVLRHPPGDVRAAGGSELLRDGAFGFDSAEDAVFDLTAREAIV